MVSGVFPPPCPNAVLFWEGDIIDKVSDSASKLWLFWRASLPMCLIKQQLAQLGGRKAGRVILATAQRKSSPAKETVTQSCNNLCHGSTWWDGTPEDNLCSSWSHVGMTTLPGKEKKWRTDSYLDYLRCHHRLERQSCWPRWGWPCELDTSYHNAMPTVSLCSFNNIFPCLGGAFRLNPRFSAVQSYCTGIFSLCGQPKHVVWI